MYVSVYICTPYTQLETRALNHMCRPSYVYKFMRTHVLPRHSRTWRPCVQRRGGGQGLRRTRSGGAGTRVGRRPDLTPRPEDGDDVQHPQCRSLKRTLGPCNPSCAKLCPDAAAGSNTSEARRGRAAPALFSSASLPEVRVLKRSFFEAILLSGWQPAQPRLLQGSQSASYERISAANDILARFCGSFE